MRLSAVLIGVSAAVFALVGLGYLVAPASMLAVVGIDGTPTTNFLMRTEGVALIAGAMLLWAARMGTVGQRTVALAALAGYYVIGSAVDLAAFSEGVVGPASVPSGVARIGAGALCAWAAWRESRHRRGG